MIIDSHVHIGSYKAPDPSFLLAEMNAHGVDRLLLFAQEPAYHEQEEGRRRQGNLRRMDDLFTWCDGSAGRLLPVYFVNPIDPDAIAQVDEAIARGAIGFKIICETFYPGDERAMPVYRHIAKRGKPMLFHSGILWDMGATSRYQRPVEWECMLAVPGARFALAHIGWPWCDELVAVYGKFLAMRWHPQYSGQEMYIDMTPGTPACYRGDVVRKLFEVGYDQMEERLLFGSDSFTDDFSGQAVIDTAEADKKFFDAMDVSATVQQGIFYGNARRFWGIKD